MGSSVGQGEGGGEEILLENLFFGSVFLAVGWQSVGEADDGHKVLELASAGLKGPIGIRLPLLKALSCDLFDQF